MAAVRRAVAAKVAAASAAVLLATAAAASAAGGGSCVAFAGHQVLSAAGDLLTLRDGRQVRARIVDVDGCTTRPNWVTGRAYPDAASNHTTMSRGTTDAADHASECVTGVPTGAGVASYTSFQAVVLEANGFRFTPSFVLEDIDAQVDAADPADGWRETMTSLGAAGGQLVLPQLSTAQGALVGVRRFAMPPASLTAVGLPAEAGLLIDGAAYLAEKPTNCPFLQDSTGRCKAFVKYTEPVDKLVIVYAVTQRSRTDPKSVAFFSELTLTCGCQCSLIRPPPGATKVEPASQGKCDVVGDTTPNHKCDFMGGLWCDTVPSSRYVLTGTGADRSCEPRRSFIQRWLSAYEPSDSFGRVR